jgi:ubiquinone biosynthesis protein COQ9
MNKEEATRAVISASLPHVPFDGWNMRSLRRGAKDAGYNASDVIRLFPEGALQAVDAFFALSDEALKTALGNYHLETMKIRQKITLAVKLRIEIHTPHPDALRRALALYTLPFNFPRGMKNLYRTVDAIWLAIGDTSTDFNFYTKRATLAMVYMATIQHWLNDESAGKQATWDYLDRRIEDVMKIEKFKYQLRQFREKITA